jgi:hypothetical protein
VRAIGLNVEGALAYDPNVDLVTLFQAESLDDRGGQTDR